MYSEADQKRDEKKIRLRAAILTTLINGGIIAAFIFTLAWAPPNPPIPEYGIEVNFGLDDIGSGDIQNKTPANDNESFDKAKPATPTPEPETSTPEPEPEPQPEPITQPTPTPDPVVEEVTPDPIVPVEAESEESVVTTPEPVKEEKPEPDPQPEEPVKKPEPEPQPEPKEETKTTTTTENTKPQTSDSESTTDTKASDTGTADEDQANNNGNGQNGEVGDQGKPQGNINADALLGAASGGGGAALDMPGWKWDEKPNVVDQSNETGKIVFEIKIDDEGEVLSVKTVARTVSRVVANYYQRAVEDLTFTPDSNNGRPAPITTGRITFVITSK